MVGDFPPLRGAELAARCLLDQIEVIKRLMISTWSCLLIDRYWKTLTATCCTTDGLMGSSTMNQAEKQ